MKSVPPRTKITLSIAGFLSLAGIFYAANPTPFATVNTPVGVAASTTDLIVTEYCGHNVDTIDCQGNVTLLATLPGVSNCKEQYVTIAPSQSAIAGFTPGDIFVTQGPGIYKVTGGTVTAFALMPSCAEDHTGITFDHVGTFGYNMIVTCENGAIWQVDGNGIPTFIVDTGTHMEGPAIPPLSFGPFGGQILVADEFSGSVHAIDNTGNVTYDVFSNYGAEAVLVIPSVPCTFCLGGGAYFQAIENFQTGNVYQYPLTDVTGLGGNILVTSEFGGGTALITYDGANYNTTFFDNIPGGEFEGGAFADCDVPAPTATPTPTAAATATPTAAATATATATFTPTATATATATATFTPTPTATATFTPTPTPEESPTPTATATFTPTATATATATFTPTPTATATFTPTPTPQTSPTPTATATFTPTPTATATFTPTPSPTPTPTPTLTPCALASCTPPYPFVSGNPRTNIAFNESGVLRTFIMTVDANCFPQTLQLFYNDEHALTLGVRQVQVKTSSGTITTNYPVSMMVTDPDSAISPLVGSTIPDGDQAGTDVSGRPMFPAMFVTDVTATGDPLASDWQNGGTAIPPDATFGTWKAAVKTVDKTKTPNVVTVTPDGDPATNHWNLGPGSDPVPVGLSDEGYGNECRWNLSSLNLIPGHEYRLYFMVHDGDQNKAGGDAGQGCVFFVMPGTAPTPTPTPTASPTPTPTPTPTASPASLATSASANSGTTVTTPSFTLKANTTYLVFAFTDSALGDSATISGTFSGSPAFTPIGAGSQSYHTQNYNFGWWLNGGAIDSTGTIKVTFLKSTHQA